MGSGQGKKPGVASGAREGPYWMGSRRGSTVPEEVTGTGEAGAAIVVQTARGGGRDSGSSNGRTSL